MKIRTGFGYDVHRLGEGREFWLGGIKIEHFKGAIGHSDADCLIHAICDALLGAANKRDIGFWFPDNVEKFKGIDSKILLREVCRIIRQAGYEISNNKRLYRKNARSSHNCYANRHRFFVNKSNDRRKTRFYG